MGKPSYTAITVERRGDADWAEPPGAAQRARSRDGDDLLEYFGAASEDPACRVIVLRGAGRTFCAGVDIKKTTISRVEDAVAGLTEQRRSSDIIRRMRRCPQTFEAPQVPEVRYITIREG